MNPHSVFPSPLSLIRALFCAALLLAAAVAQCQTARSITPPRDTPYPGEMLLEVDLRDLDRKIMQVHQVLPVRPGPLTLLYPRWNPGSHAPVIDVKRLAGLQITANGQPVAWLRDSIDVHAFHVEVPAGASSLSLRFQHLSPLTALHTERVVMTPEIVGLQWATALLYPAGHQVSAIQARASARLPAGWKYASALDEAGREGDLVQFKPVSLETLVDSPLWAGLHTRRIELGTAGPAPVFLTLFGDSATSLQATTEQIDAHKALVSQAQALFQSRHFKRYEFLLALSEHFTGIGLEHAESSENGVRPTYFSEWGKGAGRRSLLPHEYAHSWNGKFRRPAELWTPNFNLPMQDGLLWVYEGQTEYWGLVLAARSGLVPLADTLDGLARLGASLEQRAGRAWRNLQDTTHEPIIGRRTGQDWRSWQRGEEYYSEGALLWLDVDTRIRELSAGSRSLDDFARAFFGVKDGSVEALTYGFDDVVRALDGVASNDWAAFLRRRLDSHDGAHVLDGLARGGWKLVFSDKQSEQSRQADSDFRGNDFGHSLGIQVNSDGKLGNVQWDSPAFKAGMHSAMQLIAVNGQGYKPELLREAITAARDGRGVDLLVKHENRYRTLHIDYRDGLRYPRLERLVEQPDRLVTILAPLK